MVDVQCQSCHTRIHITGLEALRDTANAALPAPQQARGDASSSAQPRQSSGSVQPRLDESFVVLDGGRRGGGPPDVHAAGPGGVRGLEESFVVLTGRGGGVGGGGAASSIERSGQPQQGLDDLFTACARTFELASTATQVDQPLCVECAGKVVAEADAAARAAEEETAAYEAALQRLQAEPPSPLSDREFQAQLAAAQSQERQEREWAEKAESDLAAAEQELARLQAAAGEVAQQEQRYWHAFNDLGLQLRAHLQERDATLAKIEAAGAQLEALLRTNVWNDVFHIWHDGAFATIGGFRLGRTAAAPVPWEEINAAWGHALLLLHTLAQACQMTFSQYRLLPMGSYARIADARATHDLYGPVNRFVCTGYDRAQVAFLACLKEFAAFARARDVADKREPLFELPYAIEGDKVGGLTIKLIFNKDSRWSKALKLLAADLKWALAWVMKANEQSGASLAMGASRPASVTGH